MCLSLKQVISLPLMVIAKVLELMLQRLNSLIGSLELVHQFIVRYHCIVVILVYSGDFI